MTPKVPKELRIFSHWVKNEKIIKGTNCNCMGCSACRECAKRPCDDGYSLSKKTTSFEKKCNVL